MISSCSKGNNSPSGVQSNYYLTAKIDGKNITSNAGLVFAQETKVGGLTFYNITGEDKKNNAYFIFYFKTKVDLDPTIKAQSFGLSYPSETSFLAIKDKEDFKFEITNDTDSYIEGVFSFTAKEIGATTTITVSNGKFKAKKI